MALKRREFAALPFAMAAGSAGAGDNVGVALVAGG